MDSYEKQPVYVNGKYPAVFFYRGSNDVNQVTMVFPCMGDTNRPPPCFQGLASQGFGSPYPTRPTVVSQEALLQRLAGASVDRVLR